MAVSPHLDDAVFSAGGTLARLADAGWAVHVVTCFTATVPDPSPFALSTQLDKGLAADVDYMALRRAEDADAHAVLGTGYEHLPLPEAPHRGYASAPELFAGLRADDRIADGLADALRPLLAGADLVLAPQALGDHVDHQVVAAVVADLAPGALWWRDTPYVVRRPSAAPSPRVPDGPEHAVAVDVSRKARAARCYRTQLGFQFGGADRVEPVLADLAAAEAARLGADRATEAVRGPVPVALTRSRPTSRR